MRGGRTEEMSVGGGSGQEMREGISVEGVRRRVRVREIHTISQSILIKVDGVARSAGQGSDPASGSGQGRARFWRLREGGRGRGRQRGDGGGRSRVRSLPACLFIAHDQFTFISQVLSCLRARCGSPAISSDDQPTDWLNAHTLLLPSLPPHSSLSGRPSSTAEAAASLFTYCPAIAQLSCTYACPLPPVAPFCLFPLRNSCLSPFRGAPPPAALMKLFIEVELSPDEIPLATELFRTLRALTDHVKTRDTGKLFQALISRLEDGTQLDRVSTEVATLLTDTMSAETTLEEFQAAFVAVVFNHDLVLRQQSVVPFMFLLPRLPDHAKSRMRDFLIPKVLKHLTVKRPVEASRMDFFAHAEAFAALVNLEFVSINGAITTIITLLRKAETRCAAVTMLGKTVELCLQQLTEKCDPTTLQDLNSALQNVTEDAFQYDINYIEESMGWSRPLHGIGGSYDIPSSASLSSRGELNKGMSTDSSSASSGLHALESYTGHRNTIFAMSYDDKRSQLISGGKDGTLIVWTSDGQVAETVDMARHYACSMDIHSSHQTLLVCGVAKEENSGSGNNRMLPPPCIHRYSAVNMGWKEQGMLSKESSKLVSCIKALGGVEHAFVTGETFHTSSHEGGGPRLDERVCYYDINTASFGNLQPVRQYTEHEDLITCVSLFPPNHNLFMSGSRDSSVRVWDRRAERCVGMFGTMQKNGRVQAHDSMITCLDAIDTNLILSAGMDTRVLRWDFRSLANSGGSAPVSSLQLDDSAVLKVSLGGGASSAAVSTLRGLYLVDFATARPVARPAEPFKDGRRIGRYHDLKWANGRNLLYAAGDDMRIDVYSLR